MALNCAGYFYPFLQVLVWICICTQSHAQNFDQAYLKWKAQQTAIDQQLQRQSVGDHYLAKPSLNVDQTSTVASVNSTKININQASVEELQQLHGIGQKKAEAIVAYRQQYGKFQQIDDLQKVKGIGPVLLNKNRHRLGL